MARSHRLAHQSILGPVVVFAGVGFLLEFGVGLYLMEWFAPEEVPSSTVIVPLILTGLMAMSAALVAWYARLPERPRG